MNLEELAKTHNWNMPTVCPVCGEALNLSENHKLLVCTNDYCPSRSSGTIAKWCDKMKIKELGLTTIEKIQDLGYFKSISSIYKDLENEETNKILSGLLGKNWENIKAEINTHKESTLAQFIAGYNISGVGEKQVQKIIDTFGFTNMEEMIGDNPDRFICEGIGSIISRKLHSGLLRTISDMMNTIKYITIKNAVKTTSGKLSGMSFCFTGAMDYPRKTLQGYVEEFGGINFDSVKKGFTYLGIADPTSTSGKAVKARSMGINLISPEEFMTMVGK